MFTIQLTQMMIVKNCTNISQSGCCALFGTSYLFGFAGADYMETFVKTSF